MKGTQSRKLGYTMLTLTKLLKDKIVIFMHALLEVNHRLLQEVYELINQIIKIN